MLRQRPSCRNLGMWTPATRGRMAEFEKKSKAPLAEVGPRQSPDAYVCGAVNDPDPYSLCSRELLPAEVSPS
jgi:hypothetical protein